MTSPLKYAVALAAAALASQAAAQITFYQHDGFGGRSYTTTQSIENFVNIGFNDQASSVVVARDRWEVCQDVGYAGRCMVLRPGRYSSLSAMGLNDKLSSVRVVARNAAIDDDRFAPSPAPAPLPVLADDERYQRRGNERLFQANVTNVRAVTGTPEQRCWVEKGQVSEPQRGDANVGGAVLGALLGGIIGHQVGGGVGKGLATAGGVVGGAAIGANVGRDRNGQVVTGPDVRRCENLPGQARAEYWDVTYNFRGREHHVQMTHPPGDTITVNRQGEPRV